MLERYYFRPDTIDRVRASWIGGPIEKYVEWLAENGYAFRTVVKRLPILMQFGEFARKHGATKLEELPGSVEGFVLHWLEKHGQWCKTDYARNKVQDEARNPVGQMLCLAIPGFENKGRTIRAKKCDPFHDLAPDFFDYLLNERGLKEATLVQYRGCLHSLEKYLQEIGLNELYELSQPS